MSQVADVIVTCSLAEEFGGKNPEGRGVPALTMLGAWLHEREKGEPDCLVRADAYAGGFKAMQCVVAVGAFNHLDIPAFLQFAWTIEWHSREDVQIMIKDEEDELFTVYEFGQLPTAD